MATFLPFKERSDFSCKVTRARPPLRKYAQGIITNLFAPTLENFSHSGSSLSASPPKSSPFAGLNSIGIEEAGYQFDSSLPSHVQSATNAATVNRMEGCDAFNIMQVFDGIKCCYHNLISRDWSKSSAPFASCNSFLSTSPTHSSDRCMCAKNLQSQMPANGYGKCSGAAAPFQRLSGYLNGYITDMDVNNQLIMDLIGDPFSGSGVPSQLPKRVVTEQPSTNSVIFPHQSHDPDSNSTLQHTKGDSVSCMSKSYLINSSAADSKKYNNMTSWLPVEPNVSNEFLAQTLHQRKHKESKKAARRRKRNRGCGKPANNTSTTTKQLLGNGCVFSASSLISGLQSLCAPTDGDYSMQTSLFSDEEDDDSSCGIVFAESSPPSMQSLNVDSKLWQRPQTMPSFVSTSIAASSCLWDDDEDDMVAVASLRSQDEDEEEDVTCLETDEIRQANKRWKACYEDNSDSGHWSDGDCSESRVSFASEDLLVTEHDLDDEGEVRKGPWEELARDRQRFQRRVAETAQALNPILCPVHRAKVASCQQRVVAGLF